MHEIKWHGSSLKPLFKFMEGVSKHKRSISDPVKRKKLEKDNELSYMFLQEPYRLKRERGRINSYIEAMEIKKPKNSDTQSSLSQEILQLQKQLQDQFLVRHAIQKALTYHPVSPDSAIENSLPKSTKQLIKDIAVLELEVVYLEQYLLSLYRKTFNQLTSSESSAPPRQDGTPAETSSGSSAPPRQDVTPAECDIPITYSDDLRLAPWISNEKPLEESNGILGQENLLDSSIQRSYSWLSQRSNCSRRTSPRTKYRAQLAADSYHSLPFSMLEKAQGATTNLCPSPTEHRETYFSDNVPETPNCISEEIIKCISAIYCELADPPVTNHDFAFSPVASSSTYDLSSHTQGEKWSSKRRQVPFFNSHFDKPFEGTEEMSGHYSRMMKVHWICRDTVKLRDVEHTLKKFRSLIYQLEEVDLRKMKHAEKLAFWINVHNALVMHAFLIYGIPQNNLKRVSLLLKAAYNVGGHTISVDMIQRSILGCRLPRPGQWLRLLFSMKTKFKVGDARKAYAIEHPEPLLHFALCAGSHSDPAVRVYTSKRVHEELENAKEEYIQSNFIVHKEQKLFLPKIVESFAKDSGLASADLMDLIEHFLPDYQRKSNQHLQHKRVWKGVDWIPHNFTFRYLLLKEVAWL